ncbi:MAG TPA: TetR/AcrR family transcriptional regulator, partial [Anaerolineae bacterium]|nr:TetR/AcrR family transcriptional regulator [Anaerolineae bacterium]
MARVIKHIEHAVKRNEILDAAQKLIYTKGYAQMSIQDILDDLKISKGAFYHYYTSKQVLLEAVIDRMLQQAEGIVLPIVDDPQLTALEKFQRYFDTVARWKTDRIDLMLALLRIWYTDDNILVRQKVTEQGLKVIMPPLTKIIQQGIQEGTLNTAYPERVCEVIFSMMLAMSDKMAEILLAPPKNTLSQLESTLEVYTDAIEHVLGVSSGSLCL